VAVSSVVAAPYFILMVMLIIDKGKKESYYLITIKIMVQSTDRVYMIVRGKMINDILEVEILNIELILRKPCHFFSHESSFSNKRHVIKRCILLYICLKLI